MNQLNVFGKPLSKCGTLNTGFYRNGYCTTGTEDKGIHTICGTMTDEFLDYTNSQGNDLITPNPAYNFPGLKSGDKWCICEGRWKQAYDNNVKINVNGNATNIKSLKTYQLIEGVN